MNIYFKNYSKNITRVGDILEFNNFKYTIVIKNNGCEAGNFPYGIIDLKTMESVNWYKYLKDIKIGETMLFGEVTNIFNGEEFDLKQK